MYNQKFLLAVMIVKTNNEVRKTTKMHLGNLQVATACSKLEHTFPMPSASCIKKFYVTNLEMLLF
jgi:hypothetical protein